MLDHSISAAPYESKKYCVQLGDKILVFDEHSILGDGNCGFTSLGTTREEVSSLLLSLAGDEKARIELADEIQGLLRENKESKLHTEESKKLFAEFDTAEADSDEQVRQLNNQLATEAKTTETKTPLSVFFQRQNLEGLIERLKDSSHLSHQTTLTALRAARLKIFQIGEKIKLCCQSRKVFERYITEGLARTEWLGYRSAKLFAQLKNYTLYVFHPAKNKPGWLELAEQQVGAAPENTFYLLHTNRFTHYNLLSIAPIPIPALTFDLKYAAPTSKNTSVHELKIDFNTLRKTVDSIDHAETKKIANAMLNACEKRAMEFNKNVQNPLMAEKLAEELIELEKMVMNDEAAIKRAGGDSHSLRRVQAVVDDVKKICIAAKASLTPSPAPIIKTDPHWQEHRLRLEQQLLLSDASLAKSFHQTLQKIADKGRQEHSPPHGIFICYAWPDAIAEQDQHLQWVQPFLIGLRHHLHAAGLSSAQLDIQDNPPGSNIDDYMKGAKTCDFVLLIGTESLLRQQEWGLSAVCTALVNIRRKRIADHKEDKRRVLPLLISGDYQNAFPAEYELYNTIKDWKGAKTTYYQQLGWLIATLYSTTEAAFEEIWKYFLATLIEGEQLVLQKGLTQDQVISQLAAEQQRKNAEDQKRESASGSLLGLMSSDERKEGKRRSLALESKQTHADVLTDSWHLPQPNDRYFTGRVAELKHLNETFKTVKETQAVILSAVSGLGGVGKTQLAIYHIHHPSQPYTLRIWFQAETDTLLHKEYLDFAQQYKLPLEEKASKADVIKAVKRFLSQQPKWLAVYDNAGSYDAIQEFLPTDISNGHLLITTRRTEWHGNADTKLEIDVFSELDAITYLKKLIQRNNLSESEEKALKELAQELGYLPLALAQAGAYIKKHGKTIVEYLALYHSHTAKMLGDKTLPVDNKNQQPVAVTWNISLEAIEADEAKETLEKDQPPLSLLVLQAISYLHPDHISRDLLERWLRTLLSINNEPAVVDSLAVDLWLDQAIGHLVDYSMIQTNVEPRTVSVHRLVQEVVRFQLQQVTPATSLESKGDAKSTALPEMSLHSILLASLADSCQEEFGLETQVLVDEKRQKNLLPHLQALVEHHDSSSNSSKLSATDLGNLLSSIGSVFIDQFGNPGQAKLYYKRALKIKEQHYGKDHWQVASTLNNLGNAYGDLGDAQTKKMLLEHALKIFEQHYGKDHTQVASTLNNLANAYGDLGDPQTQKTLLGAPRKRHFASSCKCYRKSADPAHFVPSLGCDYSNVLH